MRYEVLLTDDAAQDLDDLCGFISMNDTPQRALHVLGKIEAKLTGLGEHAERGVYPKELLELGIREFRELHFKPYRIIYRVIDTSVYVLLITDGRRDMQTLLQRRLLS